VARLLANNCNQLKRKPRIIIGTPGRINDHLERKSLSLKNVTHLVLDETDRMLDMGFGIQIDQILKFMPQKKQTLMFSATFPKNIYYFVKKIFKKSRENYQ
jgi:superfamily II DNA/RNA helicase